ncbi:calcium-dependent phosphotriesterase [Abortiporus biennis]|nr:calcium-dependent phosphotriesterase [Abortiporus biennis]
MAFALKAAVTVAILTVLFQFISTIILNGGILRVVQPLNNEHCRHVEGLDGCEKMVLDERRGVIYLACSPVGHRAHWFPSLHRFNAALKANKDYIATFDLKTEKVTQLTLNGSPELSLHGMDVVHSSQNPNELFFYLVNHRVPSTGNPERSGADSVIEIFKTVDKKGEVLEHVRTIVDPKVIVTPNDIVGSPDGQSFWFTNDYKNKLGLFREIETYLVRSTASVGYCDVNSGCKIAASDIKGANGIVKSPSNNTFYVASALGAGLYVFEKEQDNSLKLTNIVSTDRIPIDNLSIDEDGAIWAPGFPRAFDTIQRYHDLTSPASSRGIRFTLNPNHKTAYYRESPLKVETIFEDDGNIASATTSVVYRPSTKQLFLHGIASSHLTICDISA